MPFVVLAASTSLSHTGHLTKCPDSCCFRMFRISVLYCDCLLVIEPGKEAPPPRFRQRESLLQPAAFVYPIHYHPPNFCFID
ncbi:hypothetical protein GURASL_13420 [Geotalea uraniireducens]|uniref:Secreted protein n=1 Tax=Geotalea uraniireducens TaxID=351604 RepID=A0ABN6VQW2_9BACT|nr:hypothetical protein GURASL_13420 [Geotalea uraniireducens]